MKPYSKYLLLPLLALTFLFQACSDDEPEQDDPIIGTWTIQKNELSDYSIVTNFATFSRENIKMLLPEEDVEQYELILNETINDLLPKNSTVTFNSDNTIVFNDATSSDILEGESWALSSDHEELNIAFNDDDIKSLTFTVNELSENLMTLILTVSKADVEDFGDFNLEIEGVQINDFTIDYTFNFTK